MVVHENNSSLACVPSQLDADSFQVLLTTLDDSHVCPCNPDSNFIEMARSYRGTFVSVSGSVKGKLDDAFSVAVGGETFSRTVRTASCTLLVKGGRCTACRAYRGQLRAMYRRWSTRRSQVAKYTNNRYLKTPEKERKMKTLRARVVAAKKHARKLKEEIERSTERNGIHVQENLNELLIQTRKKKTESLKSTFLLEASSGSSSLRLLEQKILVR